MEYVRCGIEDIQQAVLIEQIARLCLQDLPPGFRFGSASISTPLRLSFRSAPFRSASVLALFRFSFR